MPIFTGNHNIQTVWHEGKQITEVYVFGHKCYSADKHNWTDTETFLQLDIRDYSQEGSSTGTITMRRFVEFDNTDPQNPVITACKYVKTSSDITHTDKDVIAGNFYFPLEYEEDPETGEWNPKGMACMHYSNTPSDVYYYAYPESWDGFTINQMERVDTILYEEGDLHYGDPDEYGNIRLPIYGEHIKQIEGMGIEKHVSGQSIALATGQAVTIGHGRSYQILTDEEILVPKEDIHFPASTGRFPVYAYSTSAGQNAHTTSLTSHIDTHPDREPVNIRMLGWATLQDGVISNVESISNYDGTLATITGDDTGVDGTGGWIRYTTDVHFNRRKRPRRITTPNWRLDVPPIYWGKAQPVGTQTKVTTTVYDWSFTATGRRNNQGESWTVSSQTGSWGVYGKTITWAPSRTNTNVLPADVYCEVRETAERYDGSSGSVSWGHSIIGLVKAGSNGTLVSGSLDEEGSTETGGLYRVYKANAENVASWWEPQYGYYTTGNGFRFAMSGYSQGGVYYFCSYWTTVKIEGKLQCRMYTMIAGEGGVQGKVALHVKENEWDGQQTYAYEVFDSYDDMPEDTPYDYYVPIGDLVIEEGSAVGDFTLDPDIMVA